MQRVEVMRTDGLEPGAAVEAQLQRWGDLSSRVFDQWETFNRLVAPTGQGENVLLFFDLRFGGVFVERLDEFDTPGGRATLFMVAVCLDQYGIDSAAATRFYGMLSRAVKHIRSGGRKV